MQEAQENGLVEKTKVRESILLFIILKWESPEKMGTDFSELCDDKTRDNRQNSEYRQLFSP